MPKDEKLVNTENELEKLKEDNKKVKAKKNKEKEPEVSATTQDQPIKGRALIWVLLFGMVLSFITAFISIILRSHGVIWLRIFHLQV